MSLPASHALLVAASEYAHRFTGNETALNDLLNWIRYETKNHAAKEAHARTLAEFETFTVSPGDNIIPNELIEKAKEFRAAGIGLYDICYKLQLRAFLENELKQCPCQQKLYPCQDSTKYVRISFYRSFLALGVGLLHDCFLCYARGNLASFYGIPPLLK